MGAGAAIGGAMLGSAVIGGISANKAAGAAASAQRAGLAAEERIAEKNLSFQREQWDWQKEQAKPWRDVGLATLGTYQKELNQGFNFQKEPGYNFRRDEGEKAINRAASARGGYFSGGTLRELGRYNQEYASNEYSKGYGRYQDRLNRLGQLATLGYNATTNLSNVGQNYANTVTGINQQLGQSTSQMYQNIGAINAQKAMAPFNSLMTAGQTGAGLMMGYGAMTN